jgi:hypothetical protein
MSSSTLQTIKHVGYPVPTEMWNSMEKEPKEDFVKHQAISDLLDIDLTCPNCNAVLVTAEQRNNKAKENGDKK